MKLLFRLQIALDILIILYSTSIVYLVNAAPANVFQSSILTQTSERNKNNTGSNGDAKLLKTTSIGIPMMPEHSAALDKIEPLPTSRHSLTRVRREARRYRLRGNQPRLPIRRVPLSQSSGYRSGSNSRIGPSVRWRHNGRRNYTRVVTLTVLTKPRRERQPSSRRIPHTRPRTPAEKRPLEYRI